MSVITILAYNNLALRIDKAKRNEVHGDDLKVNVAGLIETYATKQGLRRDVLRKIARGVFDVDI